MLQSGIVGAYATRANGRDHSRNNSGGPAIPSSTLSPPRRGSAMRPVAAMNFVPTHSAFSAPGHHSAVAVALAAYRSPQRRNQNARQPTPSTIPEGHETTTDLRSNSISSPVSVINARSDGHPHPDRYNDIPVRRSRYRSLNINHLPRLDAPAIEFSHGTPPPGYVEPAVCLPCEQPAAADVRSPPPVFDFDFQNQQRLQGISFSEDVVARTILPPEPSRCKPALPPGAKTKTESGGGDKSSNLPAPQNHRDNPLRHARVKTEMCHFFERGEQCRYGIKCIYAHGKHELKFCYTSLFLLEGSGQIANAMTYLSRPCMNWVSTGDCPFGRRCACIHDPSVSGSSEYPSWLPASVAKTNTAVIVDRLAAHRDNSLHQENPLIAQSIWEHCRPSCHHEYPNEEQEWRDTYALVCNGGVHVFRNSPATVRTASKKLSDLQKLCIVRAMRSADSLFDRNSMSFRLAQDYVYSPTHSLHKELCMVLQVRYYLLLKVDFDSAAEVSAEDIVREITFDEFNDRTTLWGALPGTLFEPGRCVMAHEVAFAPKGDHRANVSIWFDAIPIELVQSQIKRSRRMKAKKKTQIRNEHARPNADGVLICRTSAVDFPTRPPEIDPFVPMLPADYCEEDGHRLILGITEHRIDSIIFSKRSFQDPEQKKMLRARRKKLGDAFIGMNNFHKKWTWPKRAGLDAITETTKAPPGNIMPYIPLMPGHNSPCMRVWKSFVKTMGVSNSPTRDLSASDNPKRLGVFLSLDGNIPRANKSRKGILPHITSNQLKDDVGSSTKDDTWKEILQGQPEHGEWEEAIRIYNKKKEKSIDTAIMAPNMPLSTIPFVQH